MAHSSLPKSFLGEAISTATYILNRVPTKGIDRTSYELWTGRKPYLGNLRKWGSVEEVMVDYLPSTDMIGDPLTKGISAELFS